MIFGCLGELPLGGWPEAIIIITPLPRGSAYQYLRRHGKLEQFAPPTKEEILARQRLLWLQQARTAKAEKVAEAERSDQKRLDNLALARTTKELNAETRKNIEEERFANLEKARDALKQSKIWGKPPPDTFPSVWKANMAEQKRKETERKRLESLELAREAAKEKRERDAAIKLQRMENLKKGRKKRK